MGEWLSDIIKYIGYIVIFSIAMIIQRLLWEK